MERTTLVVYIHGLDASPTKMIEMLQFIPTTFDVYSPQINYQRQTAEDVAEDALTYIQSFASEHPDMRLVLISMSFGSVVCTYILQDMPLHIDTTYISIAGVHHGTQHVTWWNKYLLLAYYPYHVIRHLVWHDLELDTKPNCVMYFVGSQDDELVYPILSSCPDIPGATHFKVTGWKHREVLTPAIDIVRKVLMSK